MNATKRTTVKRTVRENNERPDEKFRRQLRINCKKGKKLFWKELKHTRGRDSTGYIGMRELELIF